MSTNKTLVETNKETTTPTISEIFKVGEEVKLKGSRFKIHAIKKKKLILKLLIWG